MIEDKFRVSAKPEVLLPPPRFDESATAKAQPVEPIRRSRLSSWLGKGSSVRGMITKSRALALMVIAGLATGTLGGIALVKHSERIDQATSRELVSSSSIEDPEFRGFATAETGAHGFLATGAVGGRRRIRARARTGGAQRAYRVAIIR